MLSIDYFKGAEIQTYFEPDESPKIVVELRRKDIIHKCKDCKRKVLLISYNLSLLGYYRQSNGRETEVSLSGVCTCLFLRFDEQPRSQVTDCWPHCSAIYRQTKPPLFAYKRETWGFSSQRKTLPSFSLENLEWSTCEPDVPTSFPVWFMSSRKTYPNIFAIASSGIPNASSQCRMPDTRSCMRDITLILVWQKIFI